MLSILHLIYFPLKKGAFAAKKVRQGRCDDRTTEPNGRNFGDSL